MGLALALAGISYVIWVVVMGTARGLVNNLSKIAYIEKMPLTNFPGITRWLCNSFLHAAPVWDLVGVLWLLISLVLIVGSSRQRWIISWPWLSSMCQSMAAALVAAWAAVAGIAHFSYLISYDQPPYRAAGWTSLSVALALALLMWVTTLVWLLYERARLGRGPSLRDTLRTHVP